MLAINNLHKAHIDPLRKALMAFYGRTQAVHVDAVDVIHRHDFRARVTQLRQAAASSAGWS